MSDITTSKALKKKLFRYIAPSVASMWVYTIYTMVDGMFVGRGVGEDALAAVSLAMPFITFTFALGLLFAVGASITLSVFRGKGEQNKVNEIFTTAVITALVVSVLIMVVAYWNLDSIVNFLGASASTRTYMINYLKIIIGFEIFFMTSYTLEVLVKADDHPQVAIITTTIGAVTNIILDYFFVIVFDWGVEGAAVATGISQCITFFIFIRHFISKKSNMKFIRIKYKVSNLLKMFKLGIADAVTELSSGAVIFLFNRVLLEVVGDEGVVIYAVVAYTYPLVLMTMMGINQGTQPLLSFYHGKGETTSYRYIFTLAMKVAIFASLCASIISLAIPEVVVSGFIDVNENYELFQEAVKAFRLFGLSYIPLGSVIIIAGSLAAKEKEKYALTISLCRGFVFVSISLLAMAYLFSATGIWISMAVSEGLALIMAVVILIKSNKKRAAH